MNDAVLERVALPAGLAIRFVDAATGRPIVDGLRCRLRLGPRLPPRASAVSASGVHHWPDLAGRPAGASPPSPPSPPAASGAELRVDDALGRFLPLRLDWPADGADPLRPTTIVLYGAPGRPAPAGCASVHALLEAGGRPAAWARVTLTTAGGPPRVGMSDAAGRLTLHLPAPAPSRRVAGSPPAEPSPPVDGPVPSTLVELAFHHAAGVAEDAEAAARTADDAGPEAPQRARWLAQPACDALADADGTRLGTARLSATAPLVLRTAGLPPGRSELRLVPR